MSQHADQVDGCLSAKLHDGRWGRTVATLILKYISDTFLVQCFEIEAITGVKIRGDRLGIGIDQDALHAYFLKRPGRVNAAIIKLDSLPDAYRPATNDHGFLLCQRPGFIFLLISAVEIRGLGIEFGGASIHHLEHRADLPFVAGLSHLLRQSVSQSAYLLIGKAQSLRLPEKFGRQRLGEELPLHVHDILELIHEPRVYAGEPAKLFSRGFPSQRRRNRP